MLLLSMATVAVIAQEVDEAVETDMDLVDPKAQEILDNVSKTYSEFTSIKADFDMIIDIPDTDDDEKQSGTVTIQGESYKLLLEGTQIITDNNTLWTYLEDVNEVQISYYEPEEGTITPSQIFTIYEEDFTYFYHDQEKEDGKVFEMVDLTPNDKDKPYFKIRMWIDAKTNLISKAKVFDKNGNRYIYKINNFESDVKLGEGFFNFDLAQYEDIEVIDLR